MATAGVVLEGMGLDGLDFSNGTSEGDAPRLLTSFGFQHVPLAALDALAGHAVDDFANRLPCLRRARVCGEVRGGHGEVTGCFCG